MHLFQQCSHQSCKHTWFRQEEIADSLTHFVAFLIAALCFFLLLRRLEQFPHTQTTLNACIVYGLCSMLTFLISAAYHYTLNHKYKHFLHIMDHMAIFLMIAGSYTPFTLITLAGPWGWSLFAVVWAIALVGILLKTLFTGKMNLLSTILYILMGWLAIIAVVPIIHALPMIGFFWLLLGGILYTTGVLFYLMESMPFAHTIWHLFVIAGWFAQYICIYYYVI
ncbi:MAG: hemolysin III family protein [Gammaproteobacteria bacterium]|nr:hemolysin III family protein [Gammaproteobacteria bacterium]